MVISSRCNCCLSVRNHAIKGSTDLTLFSQFFPVFPYFPFIFPLFSLYFPFIFPYFPLFSLIFPHPWPYKMAVRSQISRFDAQNAPMLSCCTGNMPGITLVIPQRRRRNLDFFNFFDFFDFFDFFEKNNHKKLPLGVEKDGFCSINIDFHTRSTKKRFFEPI